MTNPLRNPWLVAVWPGRGSVAIGAGAFLVEKLDCEEVEVIPPAPYFEIERIEVKEGIAQPGRLPTNTLYSWRNPEPDGRDLLIFVAEAQPSQRALDLGLDLVERAKNLGAERVVTFAALATPVHPSAPSRVFAVATEGALLAEVHRVSPESGTQESGAITGMNGILLAAAAERGLPALCLLGEIPFFAVHFPTPKASVSVLQVFLALAGIDLDLSDFVGHAKEVERGLVELVERWNRQQRGRSSGEDDNTFTVSTFQPSSENGDDDDSAEDEGARPLDAKTKRRIEALFVHAGSDRARAMELKNVLDEHGVFDEYEDRFLDLFKREPS